MERVHTETDAQGIEYSLYIQQDDTPIRGNALASGDDAEDKRTEDEIIKRLNDGDTWAWAQTKCVAMFKGFKGHDYLGCCCYRNTEEFTQLGGYWDDMKAEARADLLKQVAGACEVLRELGE